MKGSNGGILRERFLSQLFVSLLAVSLLFTLAGGVEAAGVNLVGPGSGCTYGATSQLGENPIENAFDGNISSAWAGDGTNLRYYEQGIQIFFSQPTTFNTIKLSEYYDIDSGLPLPRTGSYMIGYWDGSQWNWFYTTGSMIAEQPNKTTITFPTIYNAQELMLWYTSGYPGNPSASVPIVYEFEVYNNVEGTRTLSTGYLVDEIGFTLSQADTHASGWHAVEGEGGTVAEVGMAQIADTDPNLGVRYYKPFLAQSAGNVTCEFRFYVPSPMFDDACFKLKDHTDSTDAVVLRVSGGHLWYVKDDASLLDLGAISPDTWHGVKVRTDLSAGLGKVSAIYVDGTNRTATAVSRKGAKQTTSALNFTNPASNIGVFSVETGGPTGVLYLGVTRVYAGYHINEHLLTADVVTDMATPVHGWVRVGSGGSATTVGVQEINGSWDEKKSFKIQDTSVKRNVSLTNTLTSGQSGDLVFEYKFMLPEKRPGLYVDLLSGKRLAMRILTTANDLCYLNSSGRPVTLVSNYKANVWYHVKVELSVTGGTDTVTYYVNSVKKTDAVAARHNVNNLDKVVFSTTNGATVNEWWVDNIHLNPLVVYENVPQPVPVNTGEFLIGAQIEQLWKEGVNAGWDLLNPSFPDRKPVLGWFDQGDPEVTDWEIKYAAEHGINFFLYNWHRSASMEGEGAPKDWYGVHAVDGLLNAKHRDNIKFALAWGFDTSIDDLFTYEIPYWIEHLFKNPSYLRTSDGKVVLGTMWTAMDNLIAQLGSEAAVKDFFDQMSAIIADELGIPGGDGLVIISTRWDYPTDYNHIQRLLNCGADYVYNYAWFPWYPNTSDETMMNLTQGWLWEQKVNSGNRAIPTISMGWDPSPYFSFGWYGYATYRLHPANFQYMLNWAKTSFDPPVIDPAGHKMIMLDNWNEIGEGHHIMPTEQYGFGYVDAVRRVFGVDPPPHEDVIPFDAGLGIYGPYDILYPNGW